VDATKLTNGSKDEVLAKRSAPAPKSGQPIAARSEAKKVGKRATGKKAKTERPQVRTIRKSKSEKLVCRYCGSDLLQNGYCAKAARAGVATRSYRS